MAGVKIPNLDPDVSLDGTEKIPSSQGGVTSYITTQRIADFAISQVGSGAGLPTGGTTGQVLAKASNTDGDAEWVDAPDGGSIELSTPTTFVNALKFDKLDRTSTVNSSDISGSITVNPAGALWNGSYTLVVVEDGGGEPTLDAEIHIVDGADDYDTTPGNSTAYIISNIANAYVAQRFRIATVVAVQLATPTLAMVVDSDTAITFNYTNVSNEASYYVQIATDAGFTTGLQTATPAADDNSHQFTGLTASTLYYGRVQAVGDGVSYYDSAFGTDSDTTQATGLTQLSTPTLTMSADSPTAITFTNSNVANESSYLHTIATDAGFTTGVQTMPKAANTTSHQFTGLTPNTTYYGKTVAVGDGVTYSNSNPGTDSEATQALSTPAAPTSFVVDDTLDTANWTNSAGYTAVGDYEYRIGGSGAFTTATAKPISVGDVAIAIGGMEIRVKAVAGVSNASLPLTNGTAFTVAGSPSVVDADYTGSTGVQPEGTAHFWEANGSTGTYGYLGKQAGGLKLASGASGGVYASTGSSADSCIIGFNTANAEVAFSSLPIGVVIANSTGGAGPMTLFPITAGSIGSGITVGITTGDEVYLYRKPTTNEVVLLAGADPSDIPGTMTELHSWGAVTGILYHTAEIANNSTGTGHGIPGLLVTPKLVNFS